MSSKTEVSSKHGKKQGRSSPPVTRSRSKQSDQKCAVCRKTVLSDSIRCSKCNNNYHLSCTGIDGNISPNWQCLTCTHGLSSIPKNTICEDLQSKLNISDKELSVTSSKSKISKKSHKTLALKLKKLEEENKMQREYLNRKYNLLMEYQSDEESVEPSEVSEEALYMNKNRRVESWILETEKVEHAIGAQPPRFFGEPEDRVPDTTAQPLLNSCAHPLPLCENASNITYINEISSHQLAARHAIPKELPIFSGNPEDWPLFISMYESSTQTCGYSNGENLIRLQKCLKGKALDAVRMLMLLPQNVPEVIKTLRLLFGRPDQIIHSLLEKIRTQSAPKADKFDTLVDFALSVRNITATMEASKLESFMNNPCLLQELVNKLPANIKLDWAVFKQNQEALTLRDFSKWLYNLAIAASDLVLPSYSDTRKENHRNRGFINTHSSTQSTTGSKKCCVCKGDCRSVDTCNRFLSFNHKKRWEIVKDNRLCRKCLKNHGNFRCKSQKLCGKDNCIYKHHFLLHNDSKSFQNSNSSSNSMNIHPETIQHPHQTHQITGSDSKNILFRIIPVTLHANNRSFDTYAYLDDGSSITLVEETVAKHLGLEGSTEPLCLKWSQDVHRMEETSSRISLKISGKNQRQYLIQNARTVQLLDLPKQTIAMDEIVRSYPYLDGIPLSSYTNAKPSILIGLDNYKLSLPLKFREGNPSQPLATKTRLGWVICGRLQSEISSSFCMTNEENYSCHICDCNQHVNSDEQLHALVKGYFEVESSGSQSPRTMLEGKEEERARVIMENTTVKREGYYETGLLWKYDEFKFPDSMQMARKRLKSLERIMITNPSLAENISQQMIEYVGKGYVRKLAADEIYREPGQVWYLPIFPVINPNKPGKVRLVWDAAASVNGVSLNSMLLKGTDQVSSLLGVLIRFRQKRIAIRADIKEMFHRVHIRQEDQHFQRFLWPSKEPSGNPDVYVMQVMTFGATCSPSSAQYVKNKNAQDFEEKFPEAVTAILKNHYVDDYLDSLDTIEEAIEIAKNVFFIHQHAGFELRNWDSNHNEVIEALGQQVSSTIVKVKVPPDMNSDKVLGLNWNTISDKFSFSCSHKADNKILSGERRPTKREVLRCLMSIFDPLGLIAHYIIQAKILLREVWRSNIGWDEYINDEQYQKWLEWTNNLQNIQEMEIPRCYVQKTLFSCSQNTQLHTFVDASEDAFCSAVYLRVDHGSVIECSLVAAKTRVAPMKPLSIPRLELEAALLGTRLAKTVSEELSIVIHRKIFWSDSRTVLCWIRSDHRKYRQFVAFRVGEILENTEVTEWRWVPTKINVADSATRWKKVSSFHSDDEWFTGPTFLKQIEDEWPNDPKQNMTTTEEEMKSNVAIHFSHQVVEKSNQHGIIVDRFSSWTKLLRVTAFVLRFVHNHLLVNFIQCERRQGNLSQKELEEAENYLFRQAQREGYSEEWHHLSNNSDVRKTSPLYKDYPYLDDQSVMRCRGRIDAVRNVNMDFKRPIILPRYHQVTHLIIRFYHEKYHHHNHETVVNEIRQRFSISRLRSTVKKEINSCQFCKNISAKPNPPLMGDLPPERLEPYTRPFTFVGVDYFGPITIAIGRRNEKRWGVIFTCLTVRAIHLEIAHSLSTDSCIMCVRNFMARRGTPRQFFSDNGTNFKGLSNELRGYLENIDQDHMANVLNTSQTEWKFIPPQSPHMGGCWERLIRSVKKTLYKISPRRPPSDELLRSMLIEIENIVNSRPLTYVPICNEDDEALTPNHFLLGSSSGCKPFGQFTDEGTLLRKSWMISQQHANKFWKRWLIEYLPSISRRTKWFRPSSPLKVGDIVIIVDERNPLNTWPKGKVIKIYEGKDGQVRRAVVQVAAGNIFERPAAKLAVLDVQNTGKSTT